MNMQERGKLEMAAGVREFVRARLADEPSYGPVLGRLESSLSRAEVIAAKQHEGRIAAKAARAHRSEIRRVLHFQLLRYLKADAPHSQQCLEASSNRVRTKDSQPQASKLGGQGRSIGVSNGPSA